MKFWTEPALYVLARPDVREEDLVDWSNQGSFAAILEGQPVEADGLVEAAGRSCYWSYGKGRKTNAEYLKNIIESGHGSVLEHASWTFGLKGISRALSHELVRHRHLSFSQLSQRYVNEDPDFVVPPLLLEAGREDALVAFKSSCEGAAAAYKAQLASLPDAKRGKEAARAVLPNATATRVVVSGNGRALRQMLALRGSQQADAEFRRLAVLWTKMMKQLAPNTFADFLIAEDNGGKFVSAIHPRV